MHDKGEEEEDDGGDDLVSHAISVLFDDIVDRPRIEKVMESPDLQPQMPREPLELS